MHNYSIMRLDVSHADEICADIARQYEQGIASCALFMMTLVPEGDPSNPGSVIDKASILCEQYDIFRDKLAAMGLSCGILAQATIGHGYPLNHMFPFTQLTNLTDGRKGNTVCPYDEAYREFMKGQFAILAAHKPDIIMVDDDFRLMGGRVGKGCACDLHMKRVRELLGRDISREELNDRIFRDNDETVRAAFVETQRESLLDCARAYRAGIDSVNPKLPGAFCIVGNDTEFGAEIGKILAGEGNPNIIRVNNGTYTSPGARNLSHAMFRAASQIALLDEADVILAETDTCPQNRYSTSAHFLHSHFTGTILEGAAGAKHWITRAGYEPASGEAYRRILAKNAGFYQALADLLPSLHWRGCRIPVPAKPAYLPADASRNGWYNCVLERLGFPMYFSKHDGGVLCLDGAADKAIPDEDLLRALAGKVFLSSESAARLIGRGFGKYLGVDVRPWNGRRASGELLPNGNTCNAQMQVRELIPTEGAVSHSTVYHVPDGKTREPLFPGVVSYKNELGGLIVTFSGTPKAAFNFQEAFSFLNESRKAQMTDLLKTCGELPVWYTGDAEVYMRCADLPDDSYMAAVFNIGLDPLDDLPLACDRPVKRVQRLMPDGSRADVTFTADGERLNVNVPAGILDPVVLFID